MTPMGQYGGQAGPGDVGASASVARPALAAPRCLLSAGQALETSDNFASLPSWPSDLCLPELSVQGL